MIKACSHQLLLVAALALGSAPALAQSTADKARPGESIAGKAAAAKNAPAKTVVQRKRYELAAGGATGAAAAQSLAPQTSTAAPAAISEKSGCHSAKGSDA